jgi:AraC-like DNA-binding protein
MSIGVSLPTYLNKAAAPDAVLCVGAGKTAFVGSLDFVDWHVHGTSVFIAAMTGSLRLRARGGSWLSCRAAVVPAGLSHALDAGGDPLAVFYPEPNVANLSDLSRLGRMWDVSGQILTGQAAELGPFRELYENQSSLGFAGDMLDELIAFVRAGKGPPALDPRVRRMVEWLGANPADLSPLAQLLEGEGISVSRFLHLFSREIGVPFRRFRIWNRLRAASKLALSGHSLTVAAIGAGFSDSAHFSRLHREMFGLTPSYILPKIARASVAMRPKADQAGRRQGMPSALRNTRA